MNFALLEPLRAEHDDAGRGVTVECFVPPEPTAARTRVPVAAIRNATRSRFVKTNLLLLAGHYA
jgi:hypothetical protein